MFAALVLVPKGLDLLHRKPSAWVWVAAVGLGLGYGFFPHPYSVFGALPYLLLALWLLVQEVVNMLVFKNFGLANWVRVAALGYWATGAVWAVAFLADFRPLGFDPTIVGLTAAHFHIAGFVLSVVVFCLLSEKSDGGRRALGWGVLVGMPAVAAGITATKLGYSPVLEWASALGFVGMALGVVWQQMQLAFQKKHPRAARYWWLAGGACLVIGAILAGLYALRFSWPIDWVNIPNMKIWHGTLNTLGFAWLTLRGWAIVFREKWRG